MRRKIISAEEEKRATDEAAANFERIRQKLPIENSTLTGLTKLARKIWAQDTEWFVGFDGFNKYTESQIFMRNLKEQHPRFLHVKSILDCGWIGDGKFAARATPKIFDMARKNGVDKIEAKSLNYPQILPSKRDIASKFKPAKIVWQKKRNPSDGRSFVMLQSGDDKICLDLDYISQIKSIYPNSEILSDGKQQAAFVEHDDLVAIMMSYDCNEDIEPFDFKPIALADVFEPGPFKPDMVTVAMDPQKAIVGRDPASNAYAFLDFSGNDRHGWCLEEFPERDSYPTKIQLRNASRELFSYIHGIYDGFLPIFKLKNNS